MNGNGNQTQVALAIKSDQNKEVTVQENCEIDLYNNIAENPVTDQVQRKLSAEIDKNDVAIRPDGIIYLPGVFYRKRLIEAFHAGGWALYSRNIFYDKNINLVCYHGVLFVLGQFISEAVGEQKYHPNNKSMTYASAVEGAKTDCLTRCCKDLGIATELWSPNFIMEWREEFAVSEWYTDKRDNNKVLLWRRKDYPQYGWPYEISNNNTQGDSGNNGQNSLNKDNSSKKTTKSNQLNQESKTEPSFEDKCKNAKEWLFKQTGTHTVYLKMLEDMGVTTAKKIETKKQNFFLQKLKERMQQVQQEKKETDNGK